MQIGSYISLNSNSNLGAGDLSYNSIRTASDSYQYLATNNATRFQQRDGDFKWFTAPSGTAGTAITFTQAMILNSSSNLTLNVGNLVQGTAAKGINFTANTPAAGMTSQLLNWYEQGTWTPSTAYATFVGAASSSGTYTRVGRQVTVNGILTGATSVTVGASGILTSSLPFNASSDGIGSMAASTNTASGVVRVTGPYVVAVTTMSPVGSITFTATYIV
jgi:hypothetical protein